MLASLHKIADQLRAARAFPERWQFRHALTQRTLSPPAGAPVLALGEPAGSLDGLVHGGRVKLLHLAKSFPRDEHHFNLLYLVSSAIPPHAEDLAAWARAQGARLVWNQNGVGFPAWAGGRAASINRPMQRLRAMADFVIYQSEFCRLSAERFLGEISAPSETLFNPVELDEFKPARRPPEPETIRLLAAGTHNQSHRVMVALETLRLLLAAGRPAHLTIAGPMRWPGAIAEVSLALVSAGLSAHVELLPRFTQPEAVQMLQRSHLLLHAKYHDPCPTMVIEALACGVPVVGSRSGGLPELVGEDGGELIEVPLSWGNAAYPKPLQLADAVRRLMESWPQRHAAARARAERLFAADAWVDAHRRIFEGLLARA